jgi:hypothetical protein
MHQHAARVEEHGVDGAWRHHGHLTYTSSSARFDEAGAAAIQ